MAARAGITQPRPINCKSGSSAPSSLVVRYNGPRRSLVIGYTTGRAFLLALSQDLCHQSRVLRPVPVLNSSDGSSQRPLSFMALLSPASRAGLVGSPLIVSPARVPRPGSQIRAAFVHVLACPYSLGLFTSPAWVIQPARTQRRPASVQLHPGTIPPAVPLQVSNFRPPLAISARPPRLGCYCPGLEPAPD